MVTERRLRNLDHHLGIQAGWLARQGNYGEGVT